MGIQFNPYRYIYRIILGSVIHNVRYILALLFLILALAGKCYTSDNTIPRTTYQTNVTLDTATHMLSAETILTWTNPDHKPVDHMLFHMYYNAFKNSNSTFFTEGTFPDFLTPSGLDECQWSYIQIDQIHDSNLTDLSSQISYIQPDDDNLHDQTVLRLDLPTPIPPGQSIQLTYKWSAKIPHIMPRTGYNKEYYFFAQWFPKLGVYELPGIRYATQGGWNCHQYHANGEYYSDFADYTVTMQVPNDYRVASSGQLIQKTPVDINTNSWTFHVDNVIDFTWSTSPHFIKQSDSYKDTQIHFYTYPYKQNIADRYFRALKFCMKYLDTHLGPYPYPTISIVDPPIHGMFTGGMEYPTLISSLSFTFLPEGLRTPETLVMHEFIHQYFMQMVATHEVEEPWMDEGFTTYWEGRILDEYLGQSSSMIDYLEFHVGTKEFNRSEFLANPLNQSGPNTLKSYEFQASAYGPISYNKTALWLQTLERMIGTPLMDKIWKSYFTTWQFRHPCRQDFIDVVNNLVISNSKQFPEGMDWYFDQVIYGTSLCDYAITDITSTTLLPPAGYITSLQDCQPQSHDSTQQLYNSNITIQRLEDMILPLTVKVIFDDGTVLYDSLSGAQPVVNLEYLTPSPIISATIDPDTINYLDANLINNSYTLKSSKNDTEKSITYYLQSKVQHILEFLSLLI